MYIWGPAFEKDMQQWFYSIRLAAKSSSSWKEALTVDAVIVPNPILWTACSAKNISVHTTTESTIGASHNIPKKGCHRSLTKFSCMTNQGVLHCLDIHLAKSLVFFLARACMYFHTSWPPRETIRHDDIKIWDIYREALPHLSGTLGQSSKTVSVMSGLFCIPWHCPRKGREKFHSAVRK